jgi:site-specific recombinase XerD
MFCGLCHLNELKAPGRLKKSRLQCKGGLVNNSSFVAMSEKINPPLATPLIITPLLGEARPSDQVAVLPLGAVVREYIRLYAEGVSHTARAKQLDTDRFLGFLQRYRRASDIDSLKVSDWDFSATQRFVDESLKSGEAPATVSRRLATLKHMGRVLAERLPGFINPARDVRPPKQQPTRPQSISTSEVAAIRQRAQTISKERGDFTTLRNETLLTLFLDTGLRADEIRSIQISQIDARLEWIKQVRTKGRQFRKVYISQQMREPLKKYLAARAVELQRFFPNLSASTDAKLPLFISTFKASSANLKSFEMGAKSIWRVIRSYSVDTKLHPHLLRHTFATDLLGVSRDIRLVAQALGHSDVRITMRYTERGDEEVAQALETARRNSKIPQDSSS